MVFWCRQLIFPLTGNYQTNKEVNKQIKKYAATLDGKALSTVGKIKEGVIIIGNESKGISSEIIKLTDEKITIPRIGQAESLNAAVATGIILYSLVGPQVRPV